MKPVSAAWNWLRQTTQPPLESTPLPSGSATTTVPTQTLLDAATEVAFIAVTPDGRITVFNRGAERMLGHTADDILGHTLDEVHLSVELEGRAKELSLQHGRPFTPLEALLEFPRQHGMENREWTYLGKNGQRIFVTVAITTIRGPENEITGFLAVAHDITEQKWVEAEKLRYVQELEAARTRLEVQAAEMEAQAERLRDAQARAEAANRSKSEFLANMSHEIRTPMTAILGYADLLFVEGDVDAAPPARLDALQTIRRNGEHLMEIINDILDISKIEAGKLTVETVRFNPVQVAQDVILLNRSRAEARGLALKLDLANPLPESIESDPTRFRQILLNLVGNALKFTDSGEIRVKLSCPETAGPGKLQVDVSDTGIGMSAEQMSRLFRPFTQADSSMSRRFGGTGLGLTISQRLAEMLGGTISVQSLSGCGSTFTFTVATGDAGPALSGPQRVATKPAAAPALQLPEGCHVLVAEDGVDNQRLITHLLRKAGAQVTMAENGRIAVDTAMSHVESRRPFDVILMDMQMPVLDGYAATRLLREKGYRMPIVALTAHAMEEDRQRCLDAGCDDYLTKPINRQALLQLITHFTRLAPDRWRSTLLETIAAVVPVLAARSEAVAR